MSKIKNIFNYTECLSEDMLTKYISGKLSPAQKHELEKHLLDCEMCSDVVEGLEMIRDKKRISNITTELNRKIQTRISQINTKEEKKAVKIIFLQQYRTQLAVAASVIVLLGLVLFFRNNLSMKELDPASSEKIFADKFEPYQEATEDANSIEPVTESPVLNKSEPEISPEVRKVADHEDHALSEDKKMGGKDAVTTIQLKEESKSEEENYPKPDGEKQTVPPAASLPQGELSVRDEEVALAGKKVDALKYSPEKLSNRGGTFAISSSAVKKEKEQDARLLQESAQKQQTTKLMVLETKSKLEEYRAKASPNDKAGKAKKSSEGQAAKPQEVTTDALVISEVVSETDPQAISPDTIAKGLSAAGDDADNMAMQKYEQKNYSGAVEDFEKILAKEPNNYNTLFYSAVSYLSTGETDKAITNLNKVLEKKNGELYDAAQWYLSLAYIKKNDTQNARKNLVELQKNSKSQYQKQADETLKEMKK